DTTQGRFGFVRHQQNMTTNKEARKGEVTKPNLEQMADTISRLTVRLPKVYDASVLVTRQEVLIGYKTDTKKRNESADQVKKTAMSVVPRYYHIYVTDSPNIIPDIQRFQNLPPTKNIDSMLQSTMKEMK